MAIVTAFDIAKQHYEAEIAQLTRDLEVAREIERSDGEIRRELDAKLAEMERHLAEAKAEIENLKSELKVVWLQDYPKLQDENERLTEALDKIKAALENDGFDFHLKLSAIRKALAAKA